MSDETQFGSEPQSTPEAVAQAGPLIAQDVTFGVERFPAADLIELRHDLLHSGADSFQAAEIVSSFLSGRGYGVSNEEARTVAAAIETVGCPVETIQSELERVARIA